MMKHISKAVFTLLILSASGFVLNVEAGETGGGARNPNKPKPTGTTKPVEETIKPAAGNVLVNNENISERNAHTSNPGSSQVGVAGVGENTPKATLHTPQASDSGSSEQKKEKRYVTVQDSNGNWTMQDTHHPGDARYTHTYRTEEDAKDATRANNKHWNKISKDKNVMLDPATGQGDMH
jgi:hypothetical protein